MNFDAVLGLFVLMVAACLILYYWVDSRNTDYQDIEHRANAMDVLKHIHEKGQGDE